MTDSSTMPAGRASKTSGPLLSALSGRLSAFFKTGVVALQLGLLITVIYRFDLVSRGFVYLSILVFFGFIVHAHLPLARRLPFFLLLSVGSLFLVLDVANALWVLGLGLALFLIAQLPIPAAARAVLMIVASGGLAWLRVPGVESPIPGSVWPILSSLFMFRMVIYLYDRSHEKAHPSVLWPLAYFFTLPNVCFPLFPVVDYKRFRSTYYSDDDHRIYQRGVLWVYRGVYQLILYRALYFFGTIDPNQVVSTGDFIRFILTSFGLYLRVSGQFHLVVGLMLLFGFNLPETHHRYYLASSFNDFWRRINIYWKDFMMKIFYYPAYFKLRKLGDTWALVLSTLFVFFATYLLHAYQWFWLRGSMLLEWHDMLFWLILAVLVVVNSLWEHRYGRQRSLERRSRGPLSAGVDAFRIAGTFSVISILWSLWTADSLDQWIGIWQVTAPGSLILVVLPIACYVIAWALQRLVLKQPVATQARAVPRVAPGFSFARSATVTLVGTLVIGALSVAPILDRLGFDGATSEKILSLRTAQLNERDLNRLERGYYEQLMNVNQHSAELWELYNKRPADWRPLPETEVWRQTDDMLQGELVPDVSIRFKGGSLETNRWGMRDQDYEKSKPSGVYRIAVLGSSHVMGSGVDNDDTFEALLENRLNEEAGERGYGGIEVLNFAIAARSAVQHVVLLEDRVLAFQPDTVLHVAHGTESEFVINYLGKLIRSGVEIPYPGLQRLLDQAGVDPEMPVDVARQRLRPYVDEIVEWAYRRFVESCREAGATPVWVYLPMVYEEETDPSKLRDRSAEAREAGFIVVSLADVYEGHTIPELSISSWDNHPNRLGHRLIADKLYQELFDDPELLLQLDLAPLTQDLRGPTADGQ